MPASLTRRAYPAPLATAVSSSAFTAKAAALGRRFWAALVRLGEQRAASELERLASLYAHSNPELAHQLRQHVRNGLQG